MKIAFIGAHGTGKSTLCNKINDKYDLPIVESVSRICQQASNGMGLNLKDEEDCKKYQYLTTTLSFWDYKRIVDWEMDCVLARTPIDVVAYELASNPTEERVQELMNDLKSLDFSDCVFFYIPIEFDLIDDGVRPMAKEYQREIDKNMRDITKQLGLKVHPIFGSVEERMEQIDTVMDDIEVDDTVNCLCELIKGLPAGLEKLKQIFEGSADDETKE